MAGDDKGRILGDLAAAVRRFSVLAMKQSAHVSLWPREAAR